MRLFGVLGLLFGLALAMLLVLSHGAGAVWHSIAALGWGGLAIIIGFHLCLIGAMGFAWFLLGRGRADSTWARYAWGRLIRDSASEALPLSQIGGFVLGARAAALAGVSGAFAAASTVVDVTVELAAQLCYVAAGLTILQVLRPGSKFVLPIAAGVTGMAVLVCIFIAVQARGAGLVGRIGRRMADTFLGARTASSSNVQAEIHQLHRNRGRLAASTMVHFTTWVLAGVETWVTLRIMGVPLSLPATLVIDSLLYALRSIAFMVPNALGVQEGGLLFLGAMFGISADAALALSLIKRGRDLIIGLPALLLWQMMEGKQAWDKSIAGATPNASLAENEMMGRS
jgi:putative membrane protein